MAATMQTQLTPQQQNMIARAAVLGQALDMWLPIYNTTFSNAAGQGPGTVIQVPLRNVGLVKRLLVEVSGTITPGAAAGTLTALGAGNFFSQIIYTDLSNQQRISTTGWHLHAVASAKRRRPYGSVAALDAPDTFQGAGVRYPNAFGYGNTKNATFVPAALVSSTATPFRFFTEVPFAYTDHDLRGSIYANVTNATMTVQLTVNPNLFTTTGQRNVQQGMYSSTVTNVLTNFTVVIYQNFLDQLPIAQQGGPVLPLLDLSTAYLLNNTAVTGLVQNQDTPIPYANFRDFMSTVTVFNDPAEYTSPNSSVNYWALQSANYTNIFKLDPKTNEHLDRLIIGDDFPLGMEYFDHRNKPISTIQYGNMQLLANCGTVTDNQSSFFVGFESLALINMITQAGSLYGS